MLRVGLTGGIASGKTTVATMFAERGAGIVDTDAIAHRLVVPGSPALAAIVAAFGNDYLLPDGTFDRARMRRTVFADSDSRRRLERILHPRIRSAALAQAELSTAPYVLFVVPLLFETGFDRLVDRCLVVDCPESGQIERLRQRDGLGEDEARAILAAQMTRRDRLERADDIIDNSGSLESVRLQVEALDRRYRHRD